MILVRLIQRVEAALDYEPHGYWIERGHPGLKMASLIVLLAGLTIARSPGEALLGLAPAALLHLLAPGKARQALPASLIPSGMVLLVFLFITPYEPLTLEWLLHALSYALRVYGMASGGLIMISTTPPWGVLGVVRRHPMVHDSLLVFYRQTPLTVQELGLALAAQGLLGKPAWKPLTSIVLQSLDRSRLLEAVLAHRSLGSRGPRSSLPASWDPAPGLFLLASSLASLAAVVLA